MRFYEVSHNNAYNQGMPEIYKIVDGFVDSGSCSVCGKHTGYPAGDLKVQMGKTRGRIWPDIIACGSYPCLVVSHQFVNAMRKESIRLVIGGAVLIVHSVENGISLGDAPPYYWIDGKPHLAGKMDFEASGYVDVKFCPMCGNRSDNISLTYDRRHAKPPPPYVFNYDEAKGFDLFTTDLAPSAFFCTDSVYECAKNNKLTNLSFCPTEQGVFGTPLKYWNLSRK